MVNGDMCAQFVDIIKLNQLADEAHRNIALMRRFPKPDADHIGLIVDCRNLLYLSGFLKFVILVDTNCVNPEVLWIIWLERCSEGFQGGFEVRLQRYVPSLKNGVLLVVYHDVCRWITLTPTVGKSIKVHQRPPASRLCLCEKQSMAMRCLQIPLIASDKSLFRLQGRSNHLASDGEVEFHRSQVDHIDMGSACPPVN